MTTGHASDELLRRSECRWAPAQQMIDLYFPGTGWIRLDRDVLQELAAYRTRHGLTGWDETVSALPAVQSAWDDEQLSGDAGRYEEGRERADGLRGHVHHLVLVGRARLSGIADASAVLRLFRS